MTGSFEKSSIGWQLRLMQQRFGEWLEGLSVPTTGAHLPDWSVPEWLLRLLFWVIASILVGWLVWQLYTLVRPYWEAMVLAQQGQSGSQPRDDRPVTVAEWLQRSGTFAQQGNYREACRALYMAALQRLNETEPIPHEPSRTDGEYLRLVQTLARSVPYQVLIRTHEQLCFANANISEREFDRCQRAYEEIEGRGEGGGGSGGSRGGKGSFEF